MPLTIPVALLAMLLAPGVAVASDHVDGHETRGDRRGDLTDLYAWTTEPGRIAVVLTSGPLTGGRARPQEDLDLVLRLRHLSEAGAADADEYRLICTGHRANKPEQDTFECRDNHGPLTVQWNDTTERDGLRLFAGIRRDPFFIALGKVNDVHPHDEERLAPHAVDFLNNWVIRGKVTALVVEIDVDRVPGDGPLIGVVGESKRGGQPLDRIGRAEIGNFVLAETFGSSTGREDVRPAWNHEDAFALSPGHLHFYQLAAVEGLARLDRMDGATEWPYPHPLEPLVLDDWLTLDPQIPCTVNTRSFLEIEAARLADVPHETCGGRTPNDDAVDRLLTWALNGPERVPTGPPLHGVAGELAPHRGDGIDAPGAPAMDDFPFLREPK